MQPVQPILIADLFPPLHAELLILLESLTPYQWELPTIATPWTVRDMVSHLLDTDIKRLSYQRDNLGRTDTNKPLVTFEDIVEYINEQNDAWVGAAKRFSPRVLIDLHRLIGPQVHAFFRGLDPFAKAPLSVSWAGEDESQNWFDIAREYTEKWHHQQHIRMAVGSPLLNGRRWLHPALDTFMRALPHAYRNMARPMDTTLLVDITGDTGDKWTLRLDHSADATHGGWRLYHGRTDAPDAVVSLPDDVAWRLFTKGIAAEEASQDTHVEGDTGLGEHLLTMLAIMA